MAACGSVLRHTALALIIVLAAACSGAAPGGAGSTPTEARPGLASPVPAEPGQGMPALGPTPAAATEPPAAPTAAPPSATPAPATATTAPPTVTTAPPTATAVPPSATPALPTATAAPPAATPVPARPAARPSPTVAAGSPQQVFIRQIVPLAQAEQADSGVPASFSIAMAAAETGWGVSPLMKQYNNYHMVSCSKPNEDLPCVAYGNGMWNQYSSPEQAFLWQGRWMRAQPGFAEAFKHTDDVAAFTRLAAKCLVSCGGPFPQKFYDGIMAIVDQYNLRQYDARPASGG